jgi:hypothetical protein
MNEERMRATVAVQAQLDQDFADFIDGAPSEIAPLREILAGTFSEGFHAGIRRVIVAMHTCPACGHRGSLVEGYKP